MNVLAFDTCFGAVSVALRWQSTSGEWLLREAYEERQTGHAERLMPMIAEVMGGAGLGFDAIARIAVTLGPGTFTGLRVGIAAARALSLAAQLPVCGMTSLAVMAQRADLLLGPTRRARQLAVAVDARRGELYFQLFGENAGDPLTPPEALRAEAAALRLGGEQVVAVGTGARLLAEACAWTGRHVGVELENLQPHARTLAIVSPVLAPTDRLQPLYLRLPRAMTQGGVEGPNAAPRV